MTADELRAMAPKQRAAAWVRLTPEERRELWGQLAAQTPGWGLDYPEDYNDPADTPTVMRALALDVDAALSSVDTKNADQAYVDGALAGKADVGHTHAGMATMIPSTTWAGDYQITAVAFDVGTLGPGQEVEVGPFGVNPGTYCVCSPQHPSSYIVAVYNDRGDGTAVISVRNSTASTTHNNIKVHAIFLNLP